MLEHLRHVEHVGQVKHVGTLGMPFSRLGSKAPLEDNQIPTKDRPEQKTLNNEQKADITTKKPPTSKKQENKTRISKIFEEF